MLLAREQPPPLLVHLDDLRDAVLVSEKAQEVDEQLIRARKEILERLALRVRVDLRVMQKATQLVRRFHGRDELLELFPHLVQALPLLGRLEKRLCIDTVGNRHQFSETSLATSSSSIVSSIRRR